MRFMSTLPGLAASLLTLLAACATAPANPDMARCGNDYRCLSDTAFRYQKEAAELNRMAQRYELEAATAAGRTGSDPEIAKRNRSLADQLRLEARTAEQRSSELRNALPHNLVY